VLSAQYVTELFRADAPVNHTLIGVSFDWQNLTTYPSFVTKKLIFRSRSALQNSTDGPFWGTKDTPITGPGSIAPIPEMALDTCEKEGNRGSKPHGGAVGGVESSSGVRHSGSRNLFGVPKNVAEAKCS
jgi:hypothetical protein